MLRTTSEKQRREFRDSTKAAIESCADWLINNADKLADDFTPGAREWSIEFRAGDDGYFPWIEVNVRSDKADVIKYKKI